MTLDARLMQATAVPQVASGSAIVQRGRSWIARKLGDVIGLPAEGARVPLLLKTSMEEGVSIWERTFGGKLMVTRQILREGRMYEYFGHITTEFGIRSEPNVISYASARVWFCGIRLSWPLKPRTQAVVMPFGEGWRVMVRIDSPFGLLCEYDAVMVPE